MLQNAYLLAKIGADAAENERNFAEILPKIGNYPTGPLTRTRRGVLEEGSRGVWRVDLHVAVEVVKGKRCELFRQFPIWQRPC